MSSSFVQIYYGPSFKFHHWDHRPQRLKGLVATLIELGYEVQTIPVDSYNCLKIVISGYEVFRCNINNLQFNVKPSRDPICQRAIQCIFSTSEKICHACDYLWIKVMLEEQMFTRTAYAPKPFWKENLEADPVTELECLDCCRFFISNGGGGGDGAPTSSKY